MKDNIVGQINTAGSPRLYLQPLGGSNQARIGSNCNLVVLGHYDEGQLHGEAVLVDCGADPARRGPGGWIQSFPDIRHLLHPHSPVKLRAIFLTHAHNDHDEAIVRYCEAGYPLPPIHGSALTLYMLKDKLRSAGIQRHRWPGMTIFEYGEVVPSGGLTVEPVAMGHSLPGSGFLVRGGGKGIFFSSDFKLDQTTLTPHTDLQRLQQMGENKEVDVLCVDSTRALQDGTTVPEADIRTNLLDLTEKFPNYRVNIVTLGTNAEGLARAAWVAAQTGRVLAHHGKSIERTLRGLNSSGLDLPTLVGQPDLQIVSGRTQLAQCLHPSYVLNVLAGAQGERAAVLARASRDEDPHLQFSAEDIVIFSASVMPWNKGKINSMIDAIKAQGVEHVFLDTAGGKQLHASGHEHGGGLLQLAQMVQPQSAIIGLHGSTLQRKACTDRFNAIAAQAPAITLDNGQILDMTGSVANIAGTQPAPQIEIQIRADHKPAHPVPTAHLKVA